MRKFEDKHFIRTENVPVPVLKRKKNLETFVWIEEGIWRIDGLRKKQFLVKVSKMTPTNKRVFRQKRVDSITVARSVRKQLISLVEDVVHNPKPILFEDLVEEYLKEKSTVWSPTTLDRSTSYLNCYFMKRFGKVPINKIHSDDIRQHFLKVTESFAHTTKRTVRKVIKLVFDDGVNKGYLHRNPVHIQLPSKERRDKVVLTSEQLVKLYNHVSLYHREMFYHVSLIVHTGLRVGESRGLQWRDIDLVSNTISVNKTEDVKTGLKPNTKTGQNRVVPISPELKEVLLELRKETFTDDEDKVLPYWRKFAINEQSSQLKLVCRSLMIPEVGFKDLRATFITHCVQNLIPLGTVMRIVGHSDIATTNEYVRLSGIEVKNSTNSLPKLSTVS
jgi:integrase